MGSARRRRTIFELLLRRALGVDAVHAEFATDALRDRTAVSRDHRDVADALAAQPLDDVLGVCAQLVRHHDHAAEMTVEADEYVCLTRAVSAHRGGRGDLLGGYSGGAQERPAANRDTVAVDLALYALPRLLSHTRGHVKREPRLRGGVHERVAEHMGGHSVDRGGEAQQLFRVRSLAGHELLAGVGGHDPVTLAGHDLPHLWRADRERAGLVEHHCAGLAERLDRAGALHDHACAGGSRDAADERDRRREDQRAGRRDHHDRQRPHRVAARRPRDPGEQEGRGQEEARVAVGHPHERSPLRLRLLDQAHERRVGALGGRPLGPHLERPARVRGPAQHRHTLRDRNRQRLAAQCAGIDDGLAAEYRPVDRDDLPCADHDDIPRQDLLDGNLFQVTVALALCDLRRALQQRGQLPPRARGGDVLECRAAREHDANDQPRQLFAERQRPEHRDERDRVNAHVTIDHDRTGDLDGELGREQRNGRPPDRVAGIAIPRQV